MNNTHIKDVILERLLALAHRGISAQAKGKNKICTKYARLFKNIRIQTK